jgi:moderate conductance mechanosensitive channel
MGLSLATALACSALWFSQHDFTEQPDLILLAQATNGPAEAIRKEAGPARAAAKNGPGGASNSVAGAAKDEPKSAAERIGALSRGLDDSRAKLEALVHELESPLSEYQKAEAEFKRFDTRRVDAKKELQKLEEAGKAEEAEKAAAALKTLEEQWSLSRDRFNLVIEQRKTLAEKASVLRDKIERDQAALDKLTGKTTPDKAGPDQAGPDNAAPATASQKTTAGAKPGTTVDAPAGKDPAATGKTVAPAKDTKAAAAQPGVEGQPGPEARPEPKTNLAGASGEGGVIAPLLGDGGKKKPPSPELLKAQAQAQAKEQAAKLAQEKVADVGERRASLERNIEVESKLLATSEQKVEQALETKAVLQRDLDKKTADNAPAAERAELHVQLRETERRIHQARGEVEASAARLADLREELAGLAAEEAQAAAEARKSDSDVAKAQREVARLENPFTPQNLLRWLIVHGPKLLTIVMAMLLLQQFVKHFSRRIIQFIADRGERIDAEAESRAQTLVGVFRNSASLIILGGGTLMVLEEVGIPIIPLLGGAAVLGLAVAFGAQNLIRDYFTGFMILLEDQYGINDVVRIGSTSGLVEKITLRMTVVRDLEGIVHFIPHGTITTVSNMTHGFSRAVFDIHVSYGEDLERTMAVLVELGQELRRDPAFAPLILDNPEMLGVDAFAESSVVIKFIIKTRPLTQWRVKRELLLRIKRKFDELGIEIPFPQRTVHHRFETPAHASGLPFAEKKAG